MIEAAQQEARQTGDRARTRRRGPRTDAPASQTVPGESRPRRRRRPSRRSSRPRTEADRNA